MSKTIRWMAPLGLALAAACGSEGGTNDNGNGNGPGNGNGGTNPPTIDSFEISGTPIDSGGTVTLSWQVTGADSITIDQDGTDLGETAFMGSRMSNPITAPTTFTLSATNANGTVSEELDVTASQIRGIQIASFTASQSLVTSGDEITLEYEIAGVQMIDSVEITDEDGSRLEDAQGNPIDPPTLSMGTVDVVVVGNANDAVDGIDTKTFTISAAGAGTRAEATVTVDVEVADPEILNFEVNDNTNVFFFGDRPSYTFRARNADGYQLLFDGEVCVPARAFPDDSLEVLNQNCQTGFVDEAEHTVTLQVFNVNRPLDTDPVEEEITVLGAAQPMINSFTVSPDEFWQGSVNAELSWDVSSDASFVELEVIRPGQGGTFAPVLGAPTGLQVESFVVEVQASGTLATEFRITARRTDDGTMDGVVIGTDSQQEISTVEVLPTFNEPEGPMGNDTPATANLIQANGLPVRGNLSTINDVDWFGFDVQEGQSVFALAGAQAFDPTGLTIRCALDTSLQLFDESGNALSLLQTENSGQTIQEVIDLLDPPPPAAQTDCAELRAGRDAGLANLPAGRYYIAVSGDESGNYQLIVDRFNDDGDPASFVPPAQNGLPVWEIENVNISRIPMVDSGTIVPLIANLQYLHPNHFLAPNLGMWLTGFFQAGAFSGVFAPRVAHVVDYENEVSPSLNIIGGVTNQNQYPRVAIGAPGTDGDGFLLTYTVVPSRSNTVNGTAEDYDLVTTSSTGPIIPTAVFPLTTEVQLLETALPSVETVWDENSPGGMDRDPVEYPALQTTMTEYDGVTHVHFAHALSRSFFGAMGDPLELDPAVSTYLLNWQIQIVDAEGNGYEFQVPIRLQ